jgi:hypothetical protein
LPSIGPQTCGARTGSAHRKRTLDHDHSSRPRQGAHRTAHGQRPFRGAGSNGCFCVSGTLRLQLAV